MSDFSDLLLTPAGLVRLRERLADKFAEYEDIRAQRQVAFELSGDGWHDNPEFNRAQQMEANCNREIKKLSDMLTSAQVIEIGAGRRPTDAVEVGSLVTFTRWEKTVPLSLRPGRLAVTVIAIRSAGLWPTTPRWGLHCADCGLANMPKRFNSATSCSIWK